MSWVFFSLIFANLVNHLSNNFQLFDYFYNLDLVFYVMVQDSQAEYSLFGSIVHAGFSPDSGHYYAYVKAHFLSPKFNNICF
jgi:Ubiquitin carboxyl-terminal hydrolase